MNLLGMGSNAIDNFCRRSSVIINPTELDISFLVVSRLLFLFTLCPKEPNTFMSPTFDFVFIPMKNCPLFMY